MINLLAVNVQNNNYFDICLSYLKKNKVNSSPASSVSFDFFIPLTEYRWARDETRHLGTSTLILGNTDTYFSLYYDIL